LPHSSGRLRSTSFLRYIRLQRRRMLGVCVLFYSAGILYTDTVDPYRLWIASYIAAVPSDRTRSTNIYNIDLFFPLMYLYYFFSSFFVCNCRWLFSGCFIILPMQYMANPIGRHFPLELVFSSYNLKREI
jgi:hypothetical protein